MGVALQRLLYRLKSCRTVFPRCSRNVITNSLSTASCSRADILPWRTDACIRANTSDYISNLWRCNKSGGSSFVTLQFARFSHCHSTLAADEYHEDHDREEQRPLSAAEEGTSFIGVKAYLLGTSIDLKRLQAECLRLGSTHKVVPTNSRTSNYVIIRSSDGLVHLPSTRNSGSAFKYDSWEENRYRYIVVFQYGSVVLFNFSHNDEEEKQWLQFCRKYASGFFTEIKDDYGILEKPSLDKWMQDGPDYIVLKKFDIDCIRTIGSVLGQSIALDHFVRQVDEVVAEFIELNRGIEKTGTFTMQQQKLFQLVSKANSNLADVILKLGLLERSDIAWKNAKYAQIWEYLRDEYELTQRFGSLDYKLKFVEQNVRFFLEILQNVKSNTLSEKSNSLEWVIICIISVEGLIGICDIILRVVFNL